MAKQVSQSQAEHNLNRIQPMTNAAFNLLLLVIALLCILPGVFVFMISISSEASLAAYGYRLIPDTFSFSAYEFLWNERIAILGALKISTIVTISGTALGVFLTTTMGYVLSRPQYKLKTFFTYVVFIPMIFNGGMAANYVIVANVLGLRDNILSLILPLAVNSFNVIICKTFFKTTIPDSIVESAKIDGATQTRIFWQIVVPISKPVIATIGLFLAFTYWNDWFQSSLYISDRNLISLQALLNNILTNIQYLAANPSAGLSLVQYKNQMPAESVRMAIAIVIVVPIACVYPFLQRYFISGLTVGAIKG